MEGMLQLVIIGILVESLWENSKMVWQDGKFNIDMIGSLVLGIILAFTLKLDFLQLINLSPIYDWVGIIATGVIVSRGGNFVHDLFAKFKGEK